MIRILGLFALLTISLPSSIARAHHRHCAEVSSIVGRSLCKRYGWWSPPRYLPRISESLAVGNLSTLQGVEAPIGVSPRSTAPLERRLDFVVLNPRMTVGLARWLDLGFGPLAGKSIETPDDYLMLGMEAVAIANLRIDDIVVRPELAIGARWIARALRPGEQRESSSDLRIVASPRVSVEIPLSPWFAAGVTVGTDLADLRDHYAGGYVLFRTRSLGYWRGRLSPSVE